MILTWKLIDFDAHVKAWEELLTFSPMQIVVAGMLRHFTISLQNSGCFSRLIELSGAFGTCKDLRLGSIVVGALENINLLLERGVWI